MESVIQTLSDPGAWVGGILFSLIASVIYKLFGILPNKIRGFGRARILKNYKRIRLLRQNPMEVTYAISKANAQFVAFLLMCFFYLLTLLISTTFREIINQSIWAGVILGLPIFIFEFIWLFQDSMATKLVKEHGKLLNYRKNKIKL